MLVFCDVAFAELVAFDCLPTVKHRVRPTEQVEVVIVIPVVVKVCPRLGLAEQVGEVSIVTA